MDEVPVLCVRNVCTCNNRTEYRMTECVPGVGRGGHRHAAGPATAHTLAHMSGPPRASATAQRAADGGGGSRAGEVRALARAAT